MEYIIQIAASIATGYILGSIPFAYIIGRLRGIDVRKIGDQNVGASNVLRNAGLAPGIITIAVEIGKGMLAILAARIISENEAAVLAAGASAFAGHVWPVFLHFKGGVGLGVVLGVFLMLFPLQWLCTAPLGIAILVITRNTFYFAAVSAVVCGLLGFVFHEFRGEIVLQGYYVILSCMVGVSLWLKTRSLPPWTKKERIYLSVNSGARHMNNTGS